MLIKISHPVARGRGPWTTTTVTGQRKSWSSDDVRVCVWCELVLLLSLLLQNQASSASRRVSRTRSMIQAVCSLLAFGFHLSLFSCCRWSTYSLSSNPDGATPDDAVCAHQTRLFRLIKTFEHTNMNAKQCTIYYCQTLIFWCWYHTDAASS